MPKKNLSSEYPMLTFLLGKPTSVRWIGALDNLQRRLQKVFKCYVSLLSETLWLSMRMMDVLDIFIAEKDERERMARECFRTQLFSVFDTLVSLEKHKKRISSKITFLGPLISSRSFFPFLNLPTEVTSYLPQIQEEFFAKISTINRCQQATKSAFKELSEWAYGYALDYIPELPIKTNDSKTYTLDVETYALEDKKSDKTLFGLLCRTKLNAFIPATKNFSIQEKSGIHEARKGHN